MNKDIESYLYRWPTSDLSAESHWRRSAQGHWVREMPESKEALAQDSRWPSLFPAPICLVTVRAGDEVALEKVVGASIVNRFPYILALSFCRDTLSDRHHPRNRFMELLEKGGTATVQFLPQGPLLDRAMGVIADIPETRTQDRIPESGLGTRPGESNDAPVFEDAFMAYEGRLVRPGKGFEGEAVFERPWSDVGSHRVYFLEINCIQLREDIAEGRRHIHWRGLPAWKPSLPFQPADPPSVPDSHITISYEKGYVPEYVFPSASTTGFEQNERKNGMAIKHLAPLPKDQVEVDNDRARWPCFFPSSLAMITTWSDDGKANVIPCGSTTVVSRSPMIIAACISYARINARYAPRASMEMLRKRGSFGCAVPYIDDKIVSAIKYTGNVSFRDDPDKVARSGLMVEPNAKSPDLPAFPIQYDCDIIGEQKLGTHAMFLGQVRQIRVRSDVSAENPLKWCPWGLLDE
jgi:flavin reductase (DIM6/NTAB) family NADH-FMN oxidoreductase RutF